MKGPQRPQEAYRIKAKWSMLPIETNQYSLQLVLSKSIGICRIFTLVFLQNYQAGFSKNGLLPESILIFLTGVPPTSLNIE